MGDGEGDRQTGRVGGGGEEDTDREEEVMFWFVHACTHVHSLARTQTETWKRSIMWRHLVLRHGIMVDSS